MSTVELEQQDLLIGGEWKGAGSGQLVRADRPVHGRRGRQGRRRQARGRARRRRRRGRRLSRMGRHPAERAPRAAAEGRRAAEGARASTSPASSRRRPAGPSAGACSTPTSPPGMLDEAASQTTSVTGEVIPSDVPGLTAFGIRQPAGVVLGIAPWNAPVILGTRAVAQPLAFGNTVILKASEVCPRTHGEIARALQRRGAAARRGQPHHPRGPGRRRRGRRADRPSGRAAHQLHRLHPRGTARGRERRAPPQARAPRARRQGASDRAGRRGHRRGRGRGQVRRVHAPGPDLHVHRARWWSTSRWSTRSPSKLGERASELTVGDPRDPATQIGPMVNARRASSAWPGSWRTRCRTAPRW